MAGSSVGEDAAWDKIVNDRYAFENDWKWGKQGKLNMSLPDPSASRFVTKNGKNYARVGDDTDISGYQKYGLGSPQITFDEDLGNVMDADIFKEGNNRYRASKQSGLANMMGAFGSTIGLAAMFTGAMSFLGSGALTGNLASLASTGAGGQAANLAGLAQMAADAGLTGASAEAFIASGGQMGSTAFGGGGVANSWGVSQRGDFGIGSDFYGGEGDNGGGGGFGGNGMGGGQYTGIGDNGGSLGGHPFDGAKAGIGTGNSFLDQIQKMFGPGDLAKSGINFLLNQGTADQYSDAALKASQLANTLADPRRGQYQDQLSQLLTNPQAFYATNPVVQAQLDVAKNQFNANTGKMGTGGTQFNDYLKNVQNVAAGTFNDQATLLAGLGGFNQGAGYSGNVFANLQDKGIQQSQQAQYFLPDTIKKIFGNQSWGDLMSGTQGASPF